MILSAQERGETICTVIGGNFKEFCDNVIASLPPRTIKERLIDFLDIFCMGLAILGVINIGFSKDVRSILQGVLAKETVNYTMDITLGTVISTVIILTASVVIVEVILKNALKKQDKNHRVLKGSLMGAGIVAVFLFVAKFGKTVLFTVPIFIAIALVVVLFVAHKVLSRM